MQDRATLAIKNSVLSDKKVLESLEGLSLTLAISRTPYIGMPIAANIEKYWAKDITN